MRKLIQILHSKFFPSIKSFRQMYPALLVICLLVIVSLAALNITSNSSSANQTEAYKEPANLPAIQQILRQYNDLQTEHTKLQAEYVSLQFTYESTKQNADNVNALIQGLTQRDSISAQQVSDLQDKLAELRAEIPNLRIALQVATDERAVFERRFLQSQYDNTLAVDRIEEYRLIHQVLLDRITEVTDHTDITTTSNLTAEKRSNFYEMWDLWIETLPED